MNNKGATQRGGLMGDLFEPYHLQHAVPRVLYETKRVILR